MGVQAFHWQGVLAYSAFDCRAYAVLGGVAAAVVVDVAAVGSSSYSHDAAAVPETYGCSFGWHYGVVGPSASHSDAVDAAVAVDRNFPDSLDPSLGSPGRQSCYSQLQRQQQRLQPRQQHSDWHGYCDCRRCHRR